MEDDGRRFCSFTTYDHAYKMFNKYFGSRHNYKTLKLYQEDWQKAADEMIKYLESLEVEDV